MNYEKEIIALRDDAEANFVPILRPQSTEILKQIISSVNPKTILEVGTAIGYSGIIMLKTCENALLYTIEKDEERVKQAKENFEKFGVSSRATILIGDANEIIPTIRKNIDFIFLDGPKSHYNKELPYLINLLSVNGILLADNVLFMGEVLSGEMPKHKHRTTILRLREFIDSVFSDERLSAKIIDVEDGLLIFQKIKE